MIVYSISSMSACRYCSFLYYIVCFFRITQDKITMPQPPYTHHNHPPITPHPKTVFLSDLSVCVTNSLEGTPVALQNHSLRYLPSQKSLRFLVHHDHLRHTPHHHTHTPSHIFLFIQLYMSQIHARPSHFFLHRKLSHSPLMFTATHTHHNLTHLNKQMPSRKCVTG